MTPSLRKLMDTITAGQGEVPWVIVGADIAGDKMKIEVVDNPKYPPNLPDHDLIKAYQASGGEAGDPVADQLAAEIERRNLDI